MLPASGHHQRSTIKPPRHRIKSQIRVRNGFRIKAPERQPAVPTTPHAAACSPAPISPTCSGCGRTHQSPNQTPPGQLQHFAVTSGSLIHPRTNLARPIFTGHRLSYPACLTYPRYRRCTGPSSTDMGCASPMHCPCMTDFLPIPVPVNRSEQSVHPCPSRPGSVSILPECSITPDIRRGD